jgi:lactate permease
MITNYKAREGGSVMWSQNYDPLGVGWLSTLLAALPVVVMLGGLGFFHARAHVAALAGLATAILVAIFVFDMPTALAANAAAFGAAYGLLPIGWIVLNIIFLYQLTQERGQFQIMRDSIAGITQDSRLQLLLIAFCFGAFFEGAAGFGTPVAVTGAMLIGLGFSKLQASGLSLIANTAPVAFGALGTPVIALAAVSGLPLLDLSAIIGRQLAVFSLIVPVWLIVAYCGWRRAWEIWPAILVTGISFAVPQFLMSNFHGPWLVNVVAALVAMGTLIAFLKIWHPRSIMAVNEAPRSKLDDDIDAPSSQAQPNNTQPALTAAAVRAAWTPWLILTVLVFIWGLPQIKSAIDSVVGLPIEWRGLHLMIERVPPVVAAAEAEKAVYNLNLFSATGTAILLAALIGGRMMGASTGQLWGTYRRTLKLVAPSLITISAMLSLGYLTRFSGIDASLGLAFAGTGVLYPFFGTLLGWLGVALTGSDTASNVLFGSLQRITAEQLGLSPVLMASANSTGGVMGKMIDAQSIVVASTATQWYGQEGRILRYVFWHSLVLATLVGGMVMLQAYVPPFTATAIP